MNPARQRVALVAPFFGRDLRTRKERFAFAYATHLALEGIDVEVVTTTARPGAPDQNAYRGGTDNTEPFPIHRFRVAAPDRAAYAEALLAVERDRAALATHGRALLDERLRSPELVAHVRAVGGRYDAFLFLDITAPTTVYAIAEVAEQALLAPLVEDEPVARVREVGDAIAQARMVLCTTGAEATLVGELFGPAVRSRVRIVGIAADVLPAHDAALERVRRATRGEPFVLVSGADPDALAELREAGIRLVRLEESDEQDRAALFSCARAVAVVGDGFGVVTEVVEAWAYAKPVFAPAAAPGAAALIRETGGGWAVERGRWREALAEPAGDDVLSRAGTAGYAYVAAQGGWRAVALRTLEAIDALAALDDGRSRDALVAQIAYLYPLVQRQRRAIEAMRVSRFWKLRDAWFGLKRRLGMGPPEDPVKLALADDGAVQLAAIGDPYQLFREHHRLRGEDVDRMRAMLPLLSHAVAIDVAIDVPPALGEGFRGTLRSLREQIYERWSARLLVPPELSDEDAAELRGLAAADGRLRVVAPDEPRFGEGDVVVPLDVQDRLEPHALLELALAFRDDVDVVYSDEDVIDDRGLPSDPWFKPDYAPETLLTRDAIGRLCGIRRPLLERAGGVRQVLGSARWYDALLRVSEATDRVVHVPQVLYHRHARNRLKIADQLIAVEAALRRRGEDGTATATPHGVEVRYAVPGDERVCVVIPTRDRAELLEACLTSIFERTAYRNFEVIVVDNGSRERRTLTLLDAWREREPQRFRVLADPAPFNYSRLNNEAVRGTAAPFVVLLNNDTEVISPDWMEAMLGQARRPRVGAVGALLLYDDGTVQHGGVVLGILNLAGHAHRFVSGNAAGYHGALQLDTNYLAVTGACMMVEKRKLEEVGGLDEALPVSYNDVDLCLKLRAAGYRNVVVPRAKLYHYESKSRGGDDTPAKVARAMQEVETIRARWPAWSARDPYYNPNLTPDAEDFGLRL